MRNTMRSIRSCSLVVSTERSLSWPIQFLGCHGSGPKRNSLNQGAESILIPLTDSSNRTLSAQMPGHAKAIPKKRAMRKSSSIGQCRRHLTIGKYSHRPRWLRTEPAHEMTECLAWAAFLQGLLRGKMNSQSAGKRSKTEVAT